MGKAGLIVDLFLLQGWRPLPKDHLAGEVLEIGVHCQWQAELIGEEVLCGDLHE
jgi:hypothetical protein